MGVGSLLAPGNVGPANAACAVIVSASSGQVTNSGAINCILVQGVGTTVTGNVTNAGTGAINANGGAASSIGININGGATVSGSIVNNGSITALHDGIAVASLNATVSGGIINAGSISSGAGFAGIDVGASQFSGGISNSGSISGGGLGIVLAGGSTFLGGIVNSGTINGGAGLAAISSAVSQFYGGISNSGLLAGATGIYAAASTFSGGIANTGTITGTVVAIDAVSSTFSGGISNAGKITGAVNGITIGTGSAFLGGIVNTGNITGTNLQGINISTPTFSGGITNGGTIAGALDGILFQNTPTVVGVISNTGSIISAAGIAIYAVNSPGISIFNSGTLTSGGVGQPAIQFSSGATNTLTLGPGYVINGVVLGAGGDTFQLGGTGSGTLDLSTIGVAGQYQGFSTFNVVSAMWVVNNSFGQPQPWNVNGGTLAGIATLASLNVNGGGALMPGLPGTPGGILTVNGNLAMASGASYIVNVSPSAASRTNVTGAASIAGAVQVVPQAGTYAFGTTYTILNAAGSVTGTFSGASTPSPALRATLSYDADNVFLTVSPGLLQPLLGPYAPVNPSNVAGAIDGFTIGGGTPPPPFQNLFNLSGPQLSYALSQLSGEAGTGARQASFQSMNAFLSLLFDPIVGNRPAGSPAMGFAAERVPAFPPEAATAYASVLKAPMRAAENPWSVWGAGYGGAARVNGDPVIIGSNDLSTSAAGLAAGADYRATPDTVVGFALAGGGTSWSLAAGLGGGRTDAFQAGLYGAERFGAAYLSGAVGYASHWASTSRTVTIAGLDTLGASFNAQSIGGRLEGGYRSTGWAPVAVVPYAAVQAQTFYAPSYSESGSLGAPDPFALTYAQQTASFWRSELGGWFDRLLPQGEGGVLGLFARAAWAHDWRSNPSLTATFIGLPAASFVVNGARPPSDLALVTAGAEWRWRNNWSIQAKFDGELAQRASTYTGSAKIKYAW